MKSRISFLCILFFCSSISAQDKNVKDSLGKFLREKLNQLPPVNDYSDFKNYLPVKSKPVSFLKEEELANTIVIIDDKIYRLDSYEYFNLKVDTLAEPVTIIKDNTSKTGIKKILIYKTKHSTL